MSRLAGRVAIVTGASRGIGRAIALAFAAEGASLVVAARTRNELESLAAEVATEALVVDADLSRPEEPERIAQATIERFGRVDILVNNAGIVHGPIDLVDCAPSFWREVVEVNLVAPAMLARAVLPTMIAQGSGKIINVSSIGGRLGGPGQTAYKAAKAGLINLTESIAGEVKAHGIDVVGICPGGVETVGYRKRFPDGGPEPEVMDPHEIAEVALFLASDASSAITGTSIDAFGWSNPVLR